MTNEICQSLILELGQARGLNLNPVSGTPGTFYREHRAQDIRELCQQILEKRNSMFQCRREEVLIIKLNDCPQDIIKTFKRKFGNLQRGTYVSLASTFSPGKDNDWTTYLNPEDLQLYWRQQTADGIFYGTLEEFIVESNLIVEQWLINSGYDFTGIKNVLLYID